MLGSESFVHVQVELLPTLTWDLEVPGVKLGCVRRPLEGGQVGPWGGALFAPAISC